MKNDMTEPYILNHPFLDLDVLRQIGITVMDENGNCRNQYDIICDLANASKEIIKDGSTKWFISQAIVMPILHVSQQEIFQNKKP